MADMPTAPSEQTFSAPASGSAQAETPSTPSTAPAEAPKAEEPSAPAKLEKQLPHSKARAKFHDKAAKSQSTAPAPAVVPEPSKQEAKTEPKPDQKAPESSPQQEKVKEFSRANERIRTLVAEKRELERKLQEIEAKGARATSYDEAQHAIISREYEVKRQEELADIRNYQETRAAPDFKENFKYYVPLMNENYRDTLQIIRDNPDPWFALECFMQAEAKGHINLEDIARLSIPRQRNLINSATEKSWLWVNNRDEYFKRFGYPEGTKVVAQEPSASAPAQQQGTAPVSKVPGMKPSIVPKVSGHEVSDTGPHAGSTFQRLINERKAMLNA